MKIEDLLNHDDGPDYLPRDSVRYRADSLIKSYSPRPSDYRLSSRDRSPSDGTSSLLDGSEDHETGVPGDARENRPAYLIEEDTFIWYVDSLYFRLPQVLGANVFENVIRSNIQ